MGRRNIRVRPVRREQVDLRRLAAAVAALAAVAKRQQAGRGAEVQPSTSTPKPASEEAA